MVEENNSLTGQTTNPDPGNVSSAPAPTSATPTKSTGKKKWLMVFFVIITVIILAAGITSAYMFGKHHARVVYSSPPPKPISLPPQTIVYKECVSGRGKEYIIPSDLPSAPNSLPFGPIYDVKNSRVIAVEYNFTASDLLANGNKLSNTIIPFFKNNYQVDHFTITPGIPEAGQSQSEIPINVAIFVVSKAESNSVTCNSS